MNMLDRWNGLGSEAAESEVMACCSSTRWARTMAAARPFDNHVVFLKAARDIWWSLDRDDWLEAFAGHPRIGERAQSDAPELVRAWSGQEQAASSGADCDTKILIAAGNVRYEQRFGFRYLVCATGKSSKELLEILQARLKHEPAAELLEAAEEQEKIMILRIRNWLGL